jgi:hypothetical protein
MPQSPAPSRRPLAPALIAALIITLAAACATTATAPANPKLSGHWELDRSQSDLVDSKVTAAIAEWEARLRKHNGDLAVDNGGGSGSGGGYGGRRHGGGGGGAAPSGGDSGQDYDPAGQEFDAFRPLGPDFAEIHRQLVQVLSPPTLLKVSTGSDYVRIESDAMPPRDYHTDEEFGRIDEYGTAKIDSDWKGDAFELSARYSSHATLLEHYEVDARNDTLRVTYHLRDPMVGKIDVSFAYHRG